MATMLIQRRALALIIVTAVAALAAARPTASPQSETWIDPYREPAARLVGEALSGSFAWERLAELGDTFGHRLSGSQSLDDAIQWAVQQMKKDGLENVHTEPVKVPHWVRGHESAEIVAPRRHAMVMLGLGNSVGTPAEGVEGEILVVGNYEQLDAAADRGLVKGRIVLFNVPFTSYGETVQFRGTGPSRAAARGAIAVLVRSVGPPGLRLPHTGALIYTEGVPQIPAAAITTEDADRLQRMQDRGTRVRVRLKMEAKFLPDADSFNVVGEIRGREKPDEVVVVGGHFDSWDVGTGSTDDGGGCIVTWEALRLMKKLNLRPRRTVRVVLWTNEENGGQGALAYRDRYKDRARRPRADARSGRRRLPPDRVWIHRLGRRARQGQGDRDAAARHPGRSHQRRRGWGRHRTERPCGGHSGDVARRGRELLPDPPHPRRHDRQDRSDGRRARVGGDRGHDLRDCGDAGAATLGSYQLPASSFQLPGSRFQIVAKRDTWSGKLGAGSGKREAYLIVYTR